MTTGEHNGRSNSYGDPAYRSSHHAYPSIPADPEYPAGAAYPADPGYGAGYSRPDPRYPASGSPGYGNPGYGNPGYGSQGYGNQGHGNPGYGGPASGRPPADWYPPEDRYLAPPEHGYRPNGHPWSPDGRPEVEERPPGDGDPLLPGRRRSAPEQSTDTSGRRKRRKRLPLWQELPLLLVIAFCLAVLIRTFLLQAFYIPSGSMEDTLLTGDRVLVDKVIYNFREPVRGEVVVFRGTDAWTPVPTGDDDIGTLSRIGQTFGDLVGISRPGEKDFIKRVVGLPGDVVSCCSPGENPDERYVSVNGVPVKEPYVIRDSPLGDSPGGTGDCRFRQFADVKVEPGHVFVMGDHRQRSQDSRCQGQVPIENVIGRARFIVWPSDRWAGLPTSDAFDQIPQPATTGALPVTTGAPAAPDQVGLVLPLLLPLAARSPRGWARRRLAREAPPRRLAE